jgi:hypothetical protein
VVGIGHGTSEKCKAKSGSVNGEGEVLTRKLGVRCDVGDLHLAVGAFAAINRLHLTIYPATTDLRFQDPCIGLHILKHWIRYICLRAREFQPAVRGGPGSLEVT